eukprot:TRINITY_DN2674_c0_g1_i2.p1 TRINITY_DN2674_c0_g1~~TRINITY_DN2674_c0_g1_i2.p1  ORF type:complete len:432 (+),score=85.25 TRINITY_DN2674_c0_g1_i2:34-1296(+)
MVHLKHVELAYSTEFYNYVKQFLETYSNQNITISTHFLNNSEFQILNFTIKSHIKDVEISYQMQNRIFTLLSKFNDQHYCANVLYLPNSPYGLFAFQNEADGFCKVRTEMNFFDLNKFVCLFFDYKRYTQNVNLTPSLSFKHHKTIWNPLLFKNLLNNFLIPYEEDDSMKFFAIPGAITFKSKQMKRLENFNFDVHQLNNLDKLDQEFLVGVNTDRIFVSDSSKMYKIAENIRYCDRSYHYRPANVVLSNNDSRKLSLQSERHDCIELKYQRKIKMKITIPLSAYGFITDLQVFGYVEEAVPPENIAKIAENLNHIDSNMKADSLAHLTRNPCIIYNANEPFRLVDIYSLQRNNMLIKWVDNKGKNEELKHTLDDQCLYFNEKLNFIESKAQAPILYWQGTGKPIDQFYEFVACIINNFD